MSKGVSGDIGGGEDRETEGRGMWALFTWCERSVIEQNDSLHPNHMHRYEEGKFRGTEVEGELCSGEEARPFSAESG